MTALAPLISEVMPACFSKRNFVFLLLSEPIHENDHAQRPGATEE